MISNLLQVVFQLGSTILPGLLIVDILCRFGWRVLATGFLDRVLLGFVLWNCVLTAPIVLLSMVGVNFRPYYLIFFILSLIVVFSWLVVSAKYLKNIVHNLGTQTSVFMRGIKHDHLMILLVFLFLVSIYHPILLEWDTVSDYLPSAKSLASTGELFNTYRMSNYSFLNGFSVQLVYSYFYYFDASMGVRLIPFLFFLMTVISVYLFARESKTVNNPLLPVCILSTFPVTWKLLAEKSLYLEIPFVFYTTSALFLCYGASKKPTATNYLFLGASIFNLVLSKELGFFMASLFLATIVVTMFNRFYTVSKIFYILIFTSMFNVLFFIDVLGENNTFAVVREILVILFSLTILRLSEGMLKVQESSQSVKPRFAFNTILKLSVLSLFVLPLLLFTLRNFFTIGLFTYTTGPSYGEYARFTATLNIGIVWTNIFNMLSAYRLLTSSGLISIYLVFFTLGLWLTVKRRHDSGHSFLCVAFMYTLLMWTTIILSASSGDDFRRLYYFAPVVSIIVTVGFESVTAKDEKTNSNLFIVFNSALIFVLVIFFYQVDYLRSLFWRFDIFEDISLISLLLGALVALTVKSSKTQAPPQPPAPSKKTKFSMLTLQLLLVALLLQPIIAYASQHGYDPEIYYQLQHDENVGYNIFEVVNYLNRLNNSYAMLSLFGHYIPFYTNRTAIELMGHDGYLTLRSMLNREDYLKKMELNRVKYILMPEHGFPKRVENLKDLYISKFPNFDRLLVHDSLPVKVFQYFTLYEIVYQREIDRIVDYDAQICYFINASEPFSIFLKENGTSVIEGYNFVATNGRVSSFVLKIRARTINFGDSPWDTYRLIFGFENYTHFFDLYLDRNGIVVLTENHWGRSTLVESRTALDPYQWHEWSILYRAGKLTIIIDDTYEITQALHVPIIDGKVGFLADPDSVSEVDRLHLSIYLGVGE